jgi:hypothetical protein
VLKIGAGKWSCHALSVWSFQITWQPTREKRSRSGGTGAQSA